MTAHPTCHDLPGRGPALVLLHGLGGAASSFLPAATHSHLADRRRVLVDLLGFGRSERPEAFGYAIDDHARSVATLLDHLGLRRCDVVGHSMGGSVAVALAAMRPDLVGRIVLAEGVLEQGPDSASRAMAAQSEADWVATGHAAFVAQIEREAAGPGASAAHGATAGDAAAAAEFLVTLRAAAPFVVHRTAVGLTRAAGPAFREQFLSLPMPRAYVFGGRSLRLPHHAAAATEFADRGVRVLVVAGAEHHLHIEDPSGFADAVARALAR